MDIKSILILEDDHSLRGILGSEFRDINLVVHEFSRVQDVKMDFYDYALLDLRVDEESSFVLIKALKEKNPECKIVIYTGYGSVASAVEAMRLGALNYLIKPVSFNEILKSFGLSFGIENQEGKDFTRPSLSIHEYEYIQYVLNENNGNISKTARELGLHRQSLQRKLKKLP